METQGLGVSGKSSASLFQPPFDVDVSPSRFPFEAVDDVIHALAALRPEGVQVSGVALVRPVPFRRSSLRPRFLSLRELRAALGERVVFVAPGVGSKRERDRLTHRALVGALALGPYPVAVPRFTAHGALARNNAGKALAQ